MVAITINVIPRERPFYCRSTFYGKKEHVSFIGLSDPRQNCLGKCKTIVRKYFRRPRPTVGRSYERQVTGVAIQMERVFITSLPERPRARMDYRKADCTTI